MLADLDHFKSINDLYGHAAGDRVIVDFAAKLLAAAGTRGIAGRIGGEEFAVLLPLTDLAAARLLRRSRPHGLFRRRRRRPSPRHQGHGQLRRGRPHAASEGLAPLMRRADEALYKAKKNGRDSVRLSYERPDVPLVPELAWVDASGRQCPPGFPTLVPCACNLDSSRSARTVVYAFR